MTASVRAPGLVTVEGVDGAGKSTHLQLLETLLRDSGHDVIVTREPGGTIFGEKIRDILLTDAGYSIDADAELLAVFAARAQHLNEVIKPAIAAQKWVLCDRFTEASYAYQGAGRELGFDRIAALEQWTQGDFRPALTLLFLVEPEIARARVVNTGRVLDRFESEQAEFFERVNAGYRSIAQRHPDRMKIINADCSPAQVAQLIKTEITAWLAC